MTNHAVTNTRVMRRGILPALLVLSVVSSAAAQSFPPRLENYLTSGVTLSRSERQRLLNGDPITKLLDAEANKEVAVLGVVWVNAPMQRYVEAVKDIESFERGGGFKLTKMLSTPPRLEDFAALELSDEDFHALRDCRVANCAVKLGAGALKRFAAEIDWRAPDARAGANGLMRQLAFDYVTRYLEGGNQQLAVYRDNSRPTFVAREFEDMVERTPLLTEHMPDMKRYLLEFPRFAIPNLTSFLYWQETDFGLKPTVRISHLAIRETPEDIVVASKMLYASHYFWTGLEVRVLLPDLSRGPGFWFVTLNRSRSDGLSGLGGMFVRRRVRSEVKRGTLASLESTRRRLEAERPEK